MLNLQVLALTLIPLLCPVIPGEGSDFMDPLALLGVEKPVDRPFLVGTWKCTKHFSKWGRLDRKRAKVTDYKGKSYMSLHEDGSVRMLNLFKPARAKWDLNENGIILYDPAHPNRVSKLIPVRKRGEDFVWLILPFAGGANGIGMVRVSDEEYAEAERKSAHKAVKEVRSAKSVQRGQRSGAAFASGDGAHEEGDSLHTDEGL